MPHGNFLYYSTNTALSYRITKRYLGGVFYIHCVEAYTPLLQTKTPAWQVVVYL
jgi:hypothetical protein